jgi:hypothetical protein
LGSNVRSDLYLHLLDLLPLYGILFVDLLLLFFVLLHYLVEEELFLLLNSTCFELFKLIFARVSDRNH